MLDVPFLGIRQPDHGGGPDVRACGDHLLDIRKLQRAVLHFKPSKVVMLGRLAIAWDIRLRLSEAEYLLTLQKFLFGSVVQRSLTGRREWVLRNSRNTKERNRRNRTGE